MGNGNWSDLCSTISSLVIFPVRRPSGHAVGRNKRSALRRLVLLADCAEAALLSIRRRCNPQAASGAETSTGGDDAGVTLLLAPARRTALRLLRPTGYGLYV